MNQKWSDPYHQSSIKSKANRTITFPRLPETVSEKKKIDNKMSYEY